MYTKKVNTTKKKIKSNNDISPNSPKVITTSFSSININNNKNFTIKHNEEEDKNIDNSNSNSINNDYFQEYYSNKYPHKSKYNFLSYYSKKKFKSINARGDKAQLSDFIIHSEPFYSNITNLDTTKRINGTYTIKNPQKEKSKNNTIKISGNNTSKNTFNKDELEEDSNNFFSNSNTIYIDMFNKPSSNRRQNALGTINRKGNIDLSCYLDQRLSAKKRKSHKKKTENLQLTSSNFSKGVSFILDYSKDDDRDIRFNETNYNINNTRNAKSPFYTSHYDESIVVKKKKNRTPNRKIEDIKRQIEYRKKKFDTIREVEKKIKNYFLTNGISLKNRELYHQSAIIIQSTFRAYLTRIRLFKVLNLFIGIRLLFNSFVLIFAKREQYYYKLGFDSIKTYQKKYQSNNTSNNKKIVYTRNKEFKYHKKNNSMSLHKTNILLSKKLRNNPLKIELSSYLNIPKEPEDKFIKNENLILFNEKITNEKKYLEEELKKIKIENKRLQKENESYKSKEIFSSSSSITNNKNTPTDIHKNNENIEDVSVELKAIKLKKKKLETLNIPILNLKKNININKNEKICEKKKNQIITTTDKYKKLLLKYLILEKDGKVREIKRKMLHRYADVIKNLDELESIRITKFKNVIEKMNIYLKKYVYIYFFQMMYKNLYLREAYKNKENNSQSLLIRGEEKSKILKKIIFNSMKKKNEIIKILFYKFYYKGIIFSLAQQKNNDNQSPSNKNGNNIYVKKRFENKNGNNNSNNINNK